MATRRTICIALSMFGGAVALQACRASAVPVTYATAMAAVTILLHLTVRQEPSCVRVDIDRRHMGKQAMGARSGSGLGAV